MTATAQASRRTERPPIELNYVSLQAIKELQDWLRELRDVNRLLKQHMSPTKHNHTLERRRIAWRQIRQAREDLDALLLEEE